MTRSRDHGGGLDAARAVWGGTRADWLDLSTGINPVPYPLPDLPPEVWTALPDGGAQTALEQAARRFWNVPAGAMVLAAPGASALIARLPGLAPPGCVDIPGPTYNEHAAAFRAHSWTLAASGATARVLVHPNNPDGRLWSAADATAPLTIIDESFCDTCPEKSLISLADQDGTVVLKSFGKFWGLAGLRLGFAIGSPRTLAPLVEALGPWPVSGPALHIGHHALTNEAWATATRSARTQDANRLDQVMARHGRFLGGTDLFRTYETADAVGLQTRLARQRIWSRTFPYSKSWVRLGLPPVGGWSRLEDVLA